MLTRRPLLALSAVSLALLATPRPAAAQSAPDATAFVQKLGNELAAVVNGPGPREAKAGQLQPIIENAVDVDGIARFVLGRFYRLATPQQQTEFQRLFHTVLINNIAGNLGQFKGVTFNMTSTQQRDGETLVGTLIHRPNQEPNNVQWVVTSAAGQPKVIDVIAEGTSLRLTRRNDYASYLTQNKNNIDALLSAMRQQAAG